MIVELGLAQSRAKARAAIEAGGVEVDGVTAVRASQRIEASAVLSVCENRMAHVEPLDARRDYALDGHRALDPNQIARLARSSEKTIATPPGYPTPGPRSRRSSCRASSSR